MPFHKIVHNFQGSLTPLAAWRLTNLKFIRDQYYTREHYFKRKYHWMADLLFILFGYSCFAYVEWTTILLVWSNPNQSKSKSAVQLVFSGYTNTLFAVIDYG